MKYKEVVKMIEDEGWYQVRQKGSHRAYKHNIRPGIVTIAYHRLSDEQEEHSIVFSSKQGLNNCLPLHQAYQIK